MAPLTTRSRFKYNSILLFPIFHEGPKEVNESNKNTSISTLLDVEPPSKLEEVTSDSDSDSKTSSESGSSSSSSSDDGNPTPATNTYNINQGDACPTGASCNRHANTATENCCKHGNQSPGAIASVESNGLSSSEPTVSKQQDSKDGMFL